MQNTTHNIILFILFIQQSTANPTRHLPVMIVFRKEIYLADDIIKNIIIIILCKSRFHVIYDFEILDIIRSLIHFIGYLSLIVIIYAIILNMTNFNNLATLQLNNCANIILYRFLYIGVRYTHPV